MNFVEVRTNLATILGLVMGIPTSWRGEPQRVVMGPSATIDMISEIGIGTDEVTYTELPVVAPTELLPTVHGQREMVIQVSIWSESQLLDLSARELASRLRTRLRFPSVIEALRGIGLGLVTIGESTHLDVEQSGRRRSGSAIELTLSYGVAETDEPLPFIEVVRVYTDTGLQNAGGTPLAPSLQSDVDVPEL